MCLVGRVAGIPSVGKPHSAFCPTIQLVLFREGRGLEIGRLHLILRARLRLNHCKKQRLNKEFFAEHLEKPGVLCVNIAQSAQPHSQGLLTSHPRGNKVAFGRNHYVN